MNNSRTIPFIVGGIVIILVVGVVFWQKSNRAVAPVVSLSPADSTPPDSASPATPATPQTPPSSAKEYTLADIAKHNTPADCWAAINGSVYNFTAWISSHPGGAAAIIGMCGKDGSVAFNAQYGGQPQPASALASFKIGELK